MPSRRAIPFLAAALLLAVLTAGVRAGQTGPAVLTGTIYDVTGGVIPGARVTLVDASQATKTAQSNAYGRFEFAAVAPGKYNLNAALPGFGSLRHEVELREAPDWNRAVILQIGSVTDTMWVSASPLPANPPSTGPAARVRVGGSVQAPRKVFETKPVYPVSMREAGLSGVVPLEAVISRDGSVSSVRVMSAQAHPDFAVAAAEAVRQWRFSPTMLNGVAVEVAMTVTVNFDLRR